jgi:hypothetical protein
MLGAANMTKKSDLILELRHELNKCRAKLESCEEALRFGLAIAIDLGHGAGDECEACQFVRIGMTAIGHDA